MKNEKEVNVEKVLEKELNGAAHANPGDSSPDLGESSLEVHDDVLEDHEEANKAVDYSTFAKKDFVDLITELSKGSDFRKIDATLRDIKPFYDDTRDKE